MTDYARQLKQAHKDRHKRFEAAGAKLRWKSYVEDMRLGKNDGADLCALIAHLALKMDSLEDHMAYMHGQWTLIQEQTAEHLKAAETSYAETQKSASDIKAIAKTILFLGRPEEGGAT